MPTAAEEKLVQTPTLQIAYEEYGPTHGPAIVLLHGFPHSPRAYDRVSQPLADLGFRILIPTLRGYGNTRFLRPDTPRSGQQAALGKDLVDFIETLGLSSALTVGFDWGRRSCVVASLLRPDLIRAQILIGGYDVQKLSAAHVPGPPEQESAMWHSHFFGTERGRQALLQHRDAYAAFLWRQWNPSKTFDAQEFALNAPYFHNPDFVDVVLSSYRHRMQLAPGDPTLEPIEQLLATQPKVHVPSTVLISGAEPLARRNEIDTTAFFSRLFRYRVLSDVGHNLPNHAPEALISEILALHQATTA